MYRDTRQYGLVSIHASVKDATRSKNCCQTPKYVSIHASVKDATISIDTPCKRLGVSIHASVKDATVAQQVLMMVDRFQSTHL